MLGMGLVVKVYFSTRDTYTYTSGCAIYGVCASGNLSLSSNTDIKAFLVARVPQPKLTSS